MTPTRPTGLDGDAYRHAFPDIAAVMIPALADEGTRLVTAYETGHLQLPAGEAPAEYGWSLAEGHAQAFTRSPHHELPPTVLRQTSRSRTMKQANGRYPRFLPWEESEPRGKAMTAVALMGCHRGKSHFNLEHQL